MNTFVRRLLTTMIVAGIATTVVLAQSITSTGSGTWSSTTPDAPWPGGIVPTAADSVIVADGHTVTIDSGAVCRTLIVGTTGASTTTARFSIDGTLGTLTVSENIVLAASTSRFRVETRSPAGVSNSFVEHLLNLSGDLDNTAGGTLDFRGGSNSSGTSNGVLLTLEGSGNSTITLSRTAYGSSNEEFNGITVNKTGGAKVILAGGNLYMSNNSSVGATILTLTSGIIETGVNNWVLLSTNGSGIVDASDASHIVGNLGRGTSNSTNATRTFPVGDVDGYRPLTVSATTSGSATGHHVLVSVVQGDANTGSSAFAGSIDKVSAIRYYKVTYLKGASGADSMGFNYYAPSYRDDDGVAEGNTDLRVGYSADERATWNGIAQTNAHTTALTSQPVEIAPDSVSAMYLVSGSSTYVALARATGTTTNALSLKVDGISKSSGKFGAWSSPSTWLGNVLPVAGDDVIIATGDTVFFDMDSVAVKSILVGEDSMGVFLFDATKNTALLVDGNIHVTARSVFKVQSRTVTGPGTSDLIHNVYLYGDLLHEGSGLDFRSGSTNTNAAVANFHLVGSADQGLTVTTPFTTSNGEFNSIQVKKSGSGKIFLGSNIYLAGGSSSNPATFPWLNLESGIIQTGEFAIIHRYASNTGSIMGGSSASYVIGAVGRGMGNSGGATRTFPVGDENGYRPFTVRSTTGGSSTGHHIIVRAHAGNANTGSSTLSPAIDKVSQIRYYDVQYVQGGGAATMDVDRLTITYGADDGVGTGNVDLRIATSLDARATWTALGQLIPDTTYTPNEAIQDSMAVVTLTPATTVLYATLGRLTGTTTNSLGTGTAVEPVDGTPTSWALGQNYPNPFNPETRIGFSLLSSTHVKLTVMNLLGQQVTTLVSGELPAGSQAIRWNGRDDAGRVMPSGVYFYRIETPEFTQTKRMILMK